MDGIRQDIRYALRSIRRTPLASGVIIATLSVGIALVTTFFSIVNTALFHPLPYRHADRTIMLAPYGVADALIQELRRSSRGLARIATYRRGGVTLTGGEETQRLSVAEVDTALFGMLDAPPLRGRGLLAEEIRRRDPVAVINERLWRTRFGGRDDIVGQPIVMDGVTRRIVGVMPEWFTFPENDRAWIPMEPPEAGEERSLLAIGMLAPGHSVDDVRREAQLVTARLRQVDSAQFHPRRAGTFIVMPDMVDRGRGRGPIVKLISLVIGGAVCVLLVACTNVASLMLARGARRRGQTVIRASLGASRWQLIRQQLVESALLAAIAGLVGTLLSIWGIRLLLRMMPDDTLSYLPGWVDLGVDANVLAFAAAVSVATVLVFGLWPARAGTRVNLASALRGSADAGVAGRDPSRRLHLPVVLELTLSVALFVAAMMMLRSFHDLSRLDRGFAVADRTRVFLTVEPRDSVAASYTQYLRRLQEQVAATGLDVALEGRPDGFRGSRLGEGFTVPETGRRLTFEELGRAPSLVSGSYFRVLGMSLLAGRAFDSTTVVRSDPLVIVSRRLAMDLWGEINVVGRSLVDPAGRRLTVLGVVSDRMLPGRSGGMAPGREMYFGANQSLAIPTGAHFIVHSTLPIPAIKRAFTVGLQVQGRDVPLNVQTLQEEESGRLLLQRLLSMVLGSFAAAGLVLAMMGIYGVVAFTVEQRTREIGVRIALGATDTAIMRHVMRGGMRLVGIAMVLGLLACAATARLITAFATGSVAVHLATAFAVAIAFAGLAMGACYVPARRAAALDPLKALRAD